MNGVKCKGTKANGEPCEAWAEVPGIYCHHHQDQADPDKKLAAPYDPPAVPTAMESDRFGHLFVALSNGRIYRANTQDRRPEWKELPSLPGTKAQEEQA